MFVILIWVRIFGIYNHFQQRFNATKIHERNNNNLPNRKTAQMNLYYTRKVRLQ